MRQANREAVFAWLDACNRKPKAELLQKVFAKQKKILAMIFPLCYSKSNKKSWNKNEYDIIYKKMP